MSEKYFDVKKASSYFQRVGNSGLDQSFSYLNVSHWGSCCQADSVWSLRFCISDELPMDANDADGRTTLWVAGLTGEHLCWNRAYQACGYLASAYLSSPRSHPWIQLPQDTWACPWPLLPIPLPLPGISPPYDPHPPLTPIHCPATRQTGLRVGPMVISSVSHPPPPRDTFFLPSRTDYPLLCTPAFLYPS